MGESLAQGPTRGRGRPPATSRERIAQASLELARDEGLDAVTIRRLAEFMRVAPMTLYGYVGTKEEIIDLMVATALEPMGREDREIAAWDERIHSGFMRLYDVLRDHPVVIEMLVGSRPITGPAVDSTRNTLLGLMDSATLSREAAVNLFNTLGGYIIGIAAVEAGRSRRAPELGSHLATLTGDEFPALKASSAAWLLPLEREMVAEGLWHLIKGFTKSRPARKRKA